MTPLISSSVHNGAAVLHPENGDRLRTLKRQCSPARLFRICAGRIHGEQSRRRAKTLRMLQRLISALRRAREPSGNFGSASVIRRSKVHSSIRVRRISSVIVRISIVASLAFDRANRGLPVEARLPEEAAASLATATQWRSAPRRTPHSLRGRRKRLQP
jgi:hypothetical protein